MKKVFLKVAAALVSTQMALAYAGTIRGSAKVMTNVVSGSKLSYDVTTSIEKDKKGNPIVHLTIQGQSSNPDFETLSIVIENSNNCAFTKPTLKASQSYYSHSNDYIGIELNSVATLDGNLVASRFHNNNPCNGEFTTDIYYTPNSVEEINTYKFKVAVFEYESAQEPNASCTSTNAPDALLVSNQNSSTTAAQYRLGDINNSGKIELDDAYDTLTIANSFSNNSVSNTLFNHYLTSNTSWREKYPNMICAEVADVDYNGKIDKADAEEILNYNSQSCVGMTPENDAIGKVIFTEIDY